jgi:DNA-binding HxlR family transcriptional regulator
MSKTCEADVIADPDPGSPSRSLLGVLTGKWSALVMGALAERSLRFGELQRRLCGVSPKMLTQALRRLEDFGLVNRVVYPTVPLHVEYSLTDLGCRAAVLLRQIEAWCNENGDKLLSASTPRGTNGEDAGP